MWRNLRRLLIALLLSLAAPATGHAYLTVPTSIEELAEFSDMVVAARVLNATPAYAGDEQCGTRYTVELEHVLKGSGGLDRGDMITLGRMDGIAAGETYLIFLNRYADAESFVERNEWRLPQLVHQDFSTLKPLILCDGLVPGYEYLEAWREDGNEGIRVPAVDFRAIPPTIAGLEIEEDDATLEREALFSYLEHLVRLAMHGPFELPFEDSSSRVAILSREERRRVVSPGTPIS